VRDGERHTATGDSNGAGAGASRFAASCVIGQAAGDTRRRFARVLGL